MDPVEEKVIAIWDFKHNAWFFFENGFFRRNPHVADEWKLVWDPEVFPYAQKKGNSFYASNNLNITKMIVNTRKNPLRGFYLAPPGRRE